jgi:hypothetical protein
MSSNPCFDVVAQANGSVFLNRRYFLTPEFKPVSSSSARLVIIFLRFRSIAGQLQLLTPNPVLRAIRMAANHRLEKVDLQVDEE